MEKTLGGDRLGSGKKQKVNLHGFDRSTHDIGYVWRSTMAAGTLVPFMKEIATAGDTFDIDLNCDVKTHPTVGPLFGSYKVQLDIFQIPLRLYHPYMMNNKIDIGRRMQDVVLPKVEMKARNSYGIDWKLNDIDNWQINPSALFSYLGIRGVGSHKDISGNFVYRYFNAIPYIGYWDIYKNYYANKQEEIGVVIHNGIGPAVNHNVSSIYNDTSGTAISAWPAIGPAVPFSPLQKLIIDNIGVAQNADDIRIGIVINTVLTYVPLLSMFTWLQTIGLNQYYTNNNVTNIIYILNWAYSDQVATPEIKLKTFPLANIDSLREKLMRHTTYPAPFLIRDTELDPFNLPLKDITAGAGDWGIMAAHETQEGLGIKTYQSDLLNNWLNKDWVDGIGGISAVTAIDTSAGSFTIDTLLISKKVYEMLNRVAVSGGTYDDWQEVMYDHKGFARAYSPIYHGGLSKELTFQEVVSQSATEGQPLATLAGKGAMSNKHKGGKVTVRVDEASYIMGIISLTPRLDYSQGNDWDININTMNDLHKPAMDEIGFQNLVTEQMAWWDTNWVSSQWRQHSAGKQPAWINYMTNVNRVRGNFADVNNEMFMTLNRRYEATATTVGPAFLNRIKDLTTYIDPTIYNQIFADTALDSQNFWVQIGVNMEVRRKMSAKVMPNL